MSGYLEGREMERILCSAAFVHVDIQHTVGLKIACESCSQRRIC